MSGLSGYLKAAVAAVVSAIGAAVVMLGPGDRNLGDLSLKDWLEVAAAVLASAGLVWFVQNVPGLAGGIIKAVIGALTAFVTAMIAALQDDVVTNAELLTAVSAAIVATGFVYQV